MDRSLDDIIDDLSAAETVRDPRPRMDRERSRSPLGRRPNSTRVKSVYVYNLPYRLTRQDLKTTFKGAGPVVKADVMEARDGVSKGCGVVEFEDEDSAMKAIQMFDRMKMMGREIGVREDRPLPESRDRRPSPPNQHNSAQPFSRRQVPPNPACTIYVSNLDFNVTWQKLKDVFKVAGRVLNVELLTDRDERPKGVATVLFDDPSMALNAISLFHGQMLMDRPMIVKMDRKAGPSPDSLSLRLNRVKDMHSDGLYGSHGSGSAGYMPRVADFSPVREDPHRYGFDHDRRDYLERLDQLSMSRKDRAMHYLNHRASQEASRGLPDMPREMARDMPREMTRDMSRDMSREMHRDMSRDMSREMHREMTREMPREMHRGSSGLGSGRPSYGGGPGYGGGSEGGYGGGGEEGGSYSILGPPPAQEQSRFQSGGSKMGRQLFVSNLSYKSTWQTLKDHFKKAGQVLHADVLNGLDGRPKGSATVLYHSNQDAVRAVDVLNQTELDGRIIAVKFDDYAK